MVTVDVKPIEIYFHMCNCSVRCAIILVPLIAFTAAPLNAQDYPLIPGIMTDPSGTPYPRDKGGTGDCLAGKACVNWLNSVAFSVSVQSLDLSNGVKDSLCGLEFANWDAAVTAFFPSTANQTSNFSSSTLMHPIAPNSAALVSPIASIASPLGP